MLEGWPRLTGLYPGISVRSSPRTVLESRYVSDKHIVSYLFMELYPIDSDTLMKLENSNAI